MYTKVDRWWCNRRIQWETERETKWKIPRALYIHAQHQVIHKTKLTIARRHTTPIAIAIAKKERFSTVRQRDALTVLLYLFNRKSIRGVAFFLFTVCFHFYWNTIKTNRKRKKGKTFAHADINSISRWRITYPHWRNFLSGLCFLFFRFFRALFRSSCVFLLSRWKRAISWCVNSERNWI